MDLHGAPLSSPSLVTADFRKFFRLGRAMLVVLPSGQGCFLHLFVCGYQGAEQDLEKLHILRKLGT